MVVYDEKSLHLCTTFVLLIKSHSGHSRPLAFFVVLHRSHILSLVDEGSRSRPRRESVYLGFTSDKPPHGDDKDDAFDEEDDAPPVPMRGTVHQQMRQERSASGAYGFSRNFSAENEEDPFDIDSISETIEYEKDDKPLKRRGLRRQGSVYEGFKGDAPKESDGKLLRCSQGV